MREAFLQPTPEPKSTLGRYRLLAPNAGVRVSPLALGGMSIGGGQWASMGNMTKESSIQLLDEYFNAGGNFIDTASN
jgi:aryl-alcohol dehydrogenase-like predicted oxidoreductase